MRLVLLTLLVGLLAAAAGGSAEALTLPGIEDAVSDPQIALDGSFLIYEAWLLGSDRETVMCRDGIRSSPDGRPEAYRRSERSRWSRPGRWQDVRYARPL